MPNILAPQSRNQNTLDGPPPQPPTASGDRAPGINRPPGTSLMQTPQAMAIQGLAMIERGSRLLTTSLPGLTPMVAQYIEQLRQITPQALSEMSSGMPGGSMPSGVPASAGMSPPPGASMP